MYVHLGSPVTFPVPTLPPVWHRLLQGPLLTLMIRLCGHEQAPVQLAYMQAITSLAQDLTSKERAAEVSLQGLPISGGLA